jgi:hypothetical protein
MNELAEHHALDGAGGADKQGSEQKSRPIYDKSASEATRELRDTSRRRRAAEEKLQQHLIQAKDHVPHHHDREVQEAEEDLDAVQGHSKKGPGDDPQEGGPQEGKPQEKDPEGDAR